jgi:ATP-dependent Clp protease ATP-binding subunit ClpC
VQVTTEHVLIGLITEDQGSSSSKNGFFNSGLTADKARAAVQSMSGQKRKPVSTTDSIPFSREVRKTFEAATNVSAGCC